MIAAFVELICIDVDASIRAYLQHCYVDLDSKTFPDQRTKRENSR
jgi:hypothetical protein